MLGGSVYRPVFWFSCCLIFLFFSYTLAAHGTLMFGDTDPLWHIAAGDLIRLKHAIPEHDPWSFTAGDYRWLNISWLWDVNFSRLHDQWGWQSDVAVNAMIVALTIVLIYINCMWHCRHFAASAITTLGAVTLLSLMLRPLQISNLMAALWMLLLGAVQRGQLKPKYLATLPLSMLAWVNMHGGFIAGPILIGAFLVQALRGHNPVLKQAMIFAWLATIAAIFTSPYGVHIIEAVWRPMTTVANQFIHEWQPFTATPQNLLSYFYLVAFCIMVHRRPLPVPEAERWLSYLWLLLGLVSNRHLSLFAIISAPVLACCIQGWLARVPSYPPLLTIRKSFLIFYNRQIVAKSAIATCLFTLIWLPTYGTQVWPHDEVRFNTLDDEVGFIMNHYPKARLLTHFDLAGIVIYQTRGTIPVFVDPRTETAIPREVFQDYLCFSDACKGWEGILERYQIDGVLLPNEGYPALIDRFSHRLGWRQAFKGPLATLFIRTREVTFKKKGQ